MLRKFLAVSMVTLLLLLLCACSAKLTTIRPTLITRITVENLETGAKAELIRKTNDEMDWLMDDLVFQMEQRYHAESHCSDTDGHLYRAVFYMGDKREFSVFVNGDLTVCKNDKRYVQAQQGDGDYDRSVNLDQWEKSFDTSPKKED